jgi:hypothetical protein
MHSSHVDPILLEGGEGGRSSVDVLSDEVRLRAGVWGSAVELRCPRCGLVLVARSRWIAAEHCPRCVAQARKLVVLLTEAAEADRPPLRVTLDGAHCTGGTR